MKSSAVRKVECSHYFEESGDAVMSDPVESRIARIESDVQHIKVDTADLRVELRRTNDRIDVTNKRIEEVRDSLTTKMEVVREDLTGRIDGLKDKLHSLTLWALLLYFTLAGGLLMIIARAFKWI